MLEKIRFHRELPDDLDQAIDFYQARSHRATNRFKTELERIFKMIEETPELFAIEYADVRIVRVRKFPYAVHYRIEHEIPRVVAILHTSLERKNWPERS